MATTPTYRKMSFRDDGSNMFIKFLLLFLMDFQKSYDKR